MKTLATIFIFILFFINSYGIAQNDTINKIDESSLKQGYWIKYFNDSTTVKEEGKYLDNKKEGIWKSYHDNGKIKSTITYNGNKPNGYAKFFYVNGNPSEEGLWKGTKWIGAYKFFHKNGKPAYEWSYNDKGKRTGVQKYYHKNGQLMIEGEWDNGKEKGVITEYYADGSLKSQKAFNDGVMDVETVKVYKKKTVKTDTPKEEIVIKKEKVDKPIQYFDGNGQHTLYTKTKKVDREGLFKRGKLIDGKRYYYNSDGEIERIAIYKNGKVSNIIYKD